ncbi:MAG TPA: 4-(cytidine 5'-diphospho)-2-C-methyl-D-erythritol kinase [Actinomycetota bacterium]
MSHAPAAGVNRVDVEAPAKVNLFLRVLGRRDDGYHELQTLVAPIGLADTVSIRAGRDADARELSLSLSLEGEPALTQSVPADGSNLVLRAARELAEAAGVHGFAEVRLHKRVPAAAGLGGGSSDAAASLRALNELWGCGLATDELSAIGARVGSDVPALLADGPALASGRGEHVEAVPLPGFSCAVVMFDFAVSTADAFGWWDDDGGETGPDPQPSLATLTAGEGGGAWLEALRSGARNDLEAPVMKRHPVIRRVRDRLLERGAGAAIMCGSGPSVAAFFAEGGRLDESVAAELAGMSGRPVVTAGSWTPKAGA